VFDAKLLKVRVDCRRKKIEKMENPQTIFTHINVNTPISFTHRHHKMPVFKNMELPAGVQVSMKFNVSNGQSTTLSDVVVLVNGPSSSADPSTTTSDMDASDSSSKVDLVRFNDPDLDSGGYLLYKPSEQEDASTYTALHMSAIVLIGLGKDDTTGNDRVWLQVSISEEVRHWEVAKGL
jgi:hypothetical protein